MNPLIEHPEGLTQQLTSRLQSLYRNQLGHTPDHIKCWFSEQSLAIILDHSLTKPEQLLLAKGRAELAERLRDHIEEALLPSIKDLIEETTHREVDDVLTRTNLRRNQTSIIAVWS